MTATSHYRFDATYRRTGETVPIAETRHPITAAAADRIWLRYRDRYGATHRITMSRQPARKDRAR